MDASDRHQPEQATATARRFSKWVLFALVSGAFAAFNGAFAKLSVPLYSPPDSSLSSADPIHKSTTADKTSSLAHVIISPPSTAATVLEVVLRGIFFALNLVCNGIMWALFTRALAAASSATRVSVLNTSTNFLVTAVLGWMWFSEKIGGLWWIGAACLVGGAAIVSRSRDGDGEGGKIRSASRAANDPGPTKTPGQGVQEVDTLLGDLDTDEGEEDDGPPRLGRLDSD